MVYIDYQALLDSYKGLSVCFIIGITIVNIHLIISVIRKGKFLYNPKSLTVISLAIGDIFLALYPLVIQAKMWFEPFYIFTCDVAKPSFVYMYFLIHFVYGVGLVVLAVELMYRYKRQTSLENNLNIVTSTLYSAMPWVLGLVVVLPVTMVNTEYTKPGLGLSFLQCFGGLTREKVHIMFGVSVLMPVFLAFIVTTAARSMRLGSVQLASPAVTYQNSAPGAVIVTQNTATNQNAVIGGVGGTQHVATAPPADSYYQNTKTAGQNILFSDTKHPTQQYPQQYPQYQYPAQVYPSQQYPQQYPQYQYPAQVNHSQQYPVPQQCAPQPYQVVDAAPAYQTQIMNPTTPAPTDPSREQNLLLTTAILHLLCVAPYSIFRMGIITSYGVIDIDRSVAEILNFSFFWLAIFRSLITPILFTCSYRK